MLNKLPDELYRNIYKYLNPISMRLIRIKTKVWCYKCGEILIGGDWFYHSEDNGFCLYYQCINCSYDNQFYDNINCDIIINQEMNNQYIN